MIASAPPVWAYVPAKSLQPVEPVISRPVANASRPPGFAVTPPTVAIVQDVPPSEAGGAVVAAGAAGADTDEVPPPPCAPPQAARRTATAMAEVAERTARTPGTLRDRPSGGFRGGREVAGSEL